MTRSEEYVLKVCQTSFLSLWCENNPKAKDGKELCDVIVVCVPHIIIISVKEIDLKVTEDPVIGYERWERKAIDASVRQIYGAEKSLASLSTIIRHDGSSGLELPQLADRRIHRLAVAFGGKEEVVIKSGDFDKSFVHVLDETSFLEVLTEMDTISDFTEYLSAKEEFTSRCRIICEGSESNVLGWYLANERKFPTSGDMMLFDNTIWSGLKVNPAFIAKKEADRISYQWDRLIESLSDQTAKPISGPGPTLTDLEQILRSMARETRFCRRILGKGIQDFLIQATAGKSRSRIMKAMSDTLYVIVYFSPNNDPKHRAAELGARCFIARHKVGSGKIVIGIGISGHVAGIGSASDLVYLNVSQWSEADVNEAKRLQANFGFYRDGIRSDETHAEYPSTM